MGSPQRTAQSTRVIWFRKARFSISARPWPSVPARPFSTFAGVGLGDEDAPLAVDGEAVEQGAEGFDDLLLAVPAGVEDEQVPIWQFRVLHDVGVVMGGEHVVVGKDMLDGVEGARVPIDVVLQAAGKLALVVGLSNGSTNSRSP